MGLTQRGLLQEVQCWWSVWYSLELCTRYPTGCCSKSDSGTYVCEGQKSDSY